MPNRTDYTRKRLAELRERLAEAEVNGESESYLALCRFKIDELEATLKREEAREGEAS